MNRAVQIVNFIGVVALVVLSVLQWRANRAINLQAEALERTRLAQVAALAVDQKTIKGQAADLDDFRERVSRLDNALKESDAKVLNLTSQRDQLQAERDELKLALAKWMDALKQRDAALTQAGAEIQKLGGERNEAVVKFNDLATKYNALVKDWNEAQKQAGK